MKIKYKYWRIDGSCVVGGDNVALHYFPILSTPSSPVVVVSLSFLPYVFHNNVFRNTIFPTSLPSLPAGEGKHDSRWRENVDIRLVYVYPRFFLRKKLVHFVDCQPERNLNIFSFIILLQRERRGRGCDECWKHRAFSLYRGICNLMEFAGNINKPSKRFPNWKNKRVNSCEQFKIGRYEYSKINERRILLIFFD